MNLLNSIGHAFQQVGHTIENTAKEVGKEMLNPTLQEHGVVNAPVVKSFNKGVQQLVTDHDAFAANKDPVVCKTLKQVFFIKDKVKEHVQQEAQSELKKQCGDYQTKYKDFANNEAIGPLITTYASSVLNSPNQQGTLPPNFDNLTVDKVCNAHPAIGSYLSSSQNKQLNAACDVVKTPTINTVCNTYPAFQSYVSPSQKQQLNAACDVIKTPNANTVCKAYPAFQSYLSTSQNNELGMLCNFVNSKDKMKTMCTLKDNPFVRSMIPTPQYKELSLGCGLYGVSPKLANTMCKSMYKKCTNNKNCCNQLVTNKSLPVINGIIEKTVNSYTPQINQQLKSRVTPAINTLLRQKVQSNLSGIKKTLQNEVDSVIGPMVSQLQGGIERADVALGSCWTTPPKTSLNIMCYNLQSKFPKGEEICASSNGCCFKLLDDVCNS